MAKLTGVQNIPAIIASYMSILHVVHVFIFQTLFVELCIVAIKSTKSKIDVQCKMQLFGTDYTVKFFVLVIRWAGKMTVSTICFNMVENSTIYISMASCKRLLVFIHTLKHSTVMMVIVLRCHDVSIVLPGPGGRAAGLGWDHYYSGSSGHIAHSTRNIVVVRPLSGILILRAKHLHMSSSPLLVGQCGGVLWVPRHTQVIGPTPTVTIPASSSDTRVQL